jgi:hypothetical protein
MTQFTGRAERPGGSEPGSQFLVAHIVASDYPEGGGRQGIARLTVSWGRIPDESGREEYTRFGTSLEDAIEAVRDAALAEQKGESRRYIEMAASRALVTVIEERELWKEAATLAETLLQDFFRSQDPPTSLAEMEDRVRAVAGGDRRTAAVMDVIARTMAVQAAVLQESRAGASA